jgi:hypothetical protein
MALTEQTVIGQIEILASGIIQVREDHRVLRDGVIIATDYSRYCLTPGQSLEGQPAIVIAHAKVAWTEEVIASFNASKLALGQV